jgi:uncharacterized protein (TIGR02680 family)
VTQDSPLPRPTTERWQPLRLGLVDLFYYDDEQFWFHDGRLLLRGNNGTGKSKVLALTLPFLLDGSLAAQRVEPDADPKKRMEWNLLLGGDHPNSERLGYTWVEFGRRDAAGQEYFTTLGCGLKAVTGRGIAKHWFFVTDRRVGDLRLVDPTGVALTRERLRDELEGRGRVYDTRDEYRRAVDEALFGLGQDRYSALVDLLIQLRQPQLSKRPDQRALSSALTEALTPLDQAVIADVAESFRSLEEDRARLLEAESTHDAAAAFLRQYTAYARVASRRAAAGVRSAQSEYERVGREQVAVEQELQQAQSDVDGATAAARELGVERSGLHGRQDALRTSPEMDAARELEHAAASAADADRAAGLARRDVERADANLATTVRERRDAAQEEERARSRAADTAAEACELAAAAGLAATHEASLADAGAARTALTRRAEQLAHVGTLVTAADAAHARAEHRHQGFDEAQARATGRAEQATESERTVDRAVTGYGERLRGYLGSLAVLEVSDAEEVLDLSDAWAVSQDGPAPARRSVDRAAAAASERVAADRARAQHEESELSADLADAHERLAELERGVAPEPPIPPARDPLARAGQPGAPLWRVTEFAEGLEAADRAGTEAALEAAGLLDAWVRPDGSVTDVATGDVVLGAGGPTAAPSLAGVLLAAVDPDETGTDDDVVRGVLARIGWGEDSGAAVWVDASGGFGIGPARGRWSKPTAQYVGAGAREASRRAAIGALHERIGQLEQRLDLLHAHLDELEARRREGEREQQEYPQSAETALVLAHAGAQSAAAELEAARSAEREAERTWQDAAHAARQAQELAVETARDVGAAHTADGLRRDREHLEAYSAALRIARDARDAAARASRDLAAARARADAAGVEHADRETRFLAADRALALAAARHRTLKGTVGKAVAELQEELGRIRLELVALDAREAELVVDRDRASRRLGLVTGRIEGLAREREGAAHRREEASTVLQRFTATQLLQVALPDLDVAGPGAAWTATAAIALSREVEAALSDVVMDQETWERVQQRTSNAFTELSAQMSRHGHTAVSEQHEEGMTVRVSYQSKELGIDVLVADLGRDIELRQQLLSEREREILENHLVTDVAGHLHELLSRAQGQVEDLNRELSGRKTSTGMQLRVLWRARPDGPAGFAVARNLLLRSDNAWNAADRSAIGGFLQEQIKTVRIADPTAGWADQLRIALDYRTWHDFTVERQQNGQWRPATGPASGGERVLTVSIPLFAAASSHYHSAGNPYAPRLILLDEAFAGVDDDSRAKSLGLLATFDLDVVMTSEREWGCYPQVPGLAIAQLARVEGIDAVGVTRWRWDGRARTLDVAPGPDSAAGEPRESDVAVGSLFD